MRARSRESPGPSSCTEIRIWLPSRRVSTHTFPLSSTAWSAFTIRFRKTCRSGPAAATTRSSRGSSRWISALRFSTMEAMRTQASSTSATSVSSRASSAGVRELAHVAHDRDGALHALHRFLDQHFDLGEGLGGRGAALAIALAQDVPVLAQRRQVGAHVGHGIVDLVRDAGRELADRIHLLRLSQLAFEATAFRHVVDDHQNAGAFVLGLLERRGRDLPDTLRCRRLCRRAALHRSDATVRPQLAARHTLGVARRLDRFGEGGARRPLDLHPRPRLGAGGAIDAPDQLAHAGVQGSDLPTLVTHDDTHGRALHQIAIALLTRGQA